MNTYKYFFLLILVLLQGCNQTIDVPEADLKPQAPLQKHSQYSSALETLGEMMESFEDKKFAVMVDTIQDRTASGGRLPTDVTMLVQSALQNVGENLLLMPYSDNAINAYSINADLSNLYIIHGAITEFDADTTTKGNGADGGGYAKGIDISAEKSADISNGTIAMDFMVQDYDKSFFVPNVKATAKASIRKISNSKGYSFSILGNGFGVNGNTTSQTPIHHVINIMIEYSMVQLIGKLKNYPYWLAIHGADPDYRLIKKAAKKYNKLPSETQHRNISYLLHYMDSSIESQQSNFDKHTQEKIKSLKRELGIIPVDARATSELYIKLLTEAPRFIKKQQTFNEADQMLNSVFE